MHIEPVPGSPPTVPPIPPDIVPPVKEPEPDRLPDEEPLPNPDENDRPVKWNRAPRAHQARGAHFRLALARQSDYMRGTLRSGP
jgi:hypothetical protein